MRPYYVLKYGLSQYAEFVEPDQNNKVTAYDVFGPEAGDVLKACKLV
jgi:hypothetical protein